MPARPLALGLRGPNRVAMGRVRRMVAALRRLGGSLWMVDNAYTGAFVDNVGTTPVTAYGDLLGLTTDRLGVLGPNLVTNGDFANGVDGWTVPAGWGLASGAMVATATSSSMVQQAAASIPGSYYEVEFDWTHAGGTLYVRVGAGTAATFATSGRKRVTLVAVSTAGIEFYGGSVSGALDNIVSRRLTGNHATQSAVASKPSVQRVPKRTRGATNLLLWSGDFSNAAWTKAGATVATGQADPLGGTSASKLVESATNSAHYFLQSVVSGTGTATSAWIVKPAGRSKIQVRSESPQTGMLATMFNLATGAIQNGTGSIVALDNGFFLCAATAPSAGTGANGYHLMQTLNDSWQETYTGDGTSGVIVYRAGLFAGTLTAQQIIDNGGIPLTTTTALPNVTEWANVISFDGSNDFLQTGITTGEQGFVAAAVTPANTTASMSVVNAGEGASTIPGVWLFGASGAWYASSANGTGREQASRAMPGAVPHVVSMRWNAASISMGVDGTETSAARTGNCASGANVLRIGMYQGSSVPFNGPMHAVVYSAVDPDAATRKIIINGLAALQGRGPL